jgi:hypothetical protein
LGPFRQVIGIKSCSSVFIFDVLKSAALYPRKASRSLLAFGFIGKMIQGPLPKRFEGFLKWRTIYVGKGRRSHKFPEFTAQAFKLVFGGQEVLPSFNSSVNRLMFDS